MTRNKKACLEKGLHPTVPQQGSKGEDKVRVNRTRVSTGPVRRFCHRPLWTPECSASGTRNSQTVTRISHNVSLKGDEAFLQGPSLPTAGSAFHEMQSPQLVGEQATVPGCSFRLNSVSSVRHSVCPSG